MSSRLSSLLVQDGLVTAKRVADAFQRQVIYGGTLDSNLLELKAVDEDDLIHYLGRADGMPTQPTGINGAGLPLPEVLEVFTREVAERFHAVPTKLLPGGVLRVLVPDGVELSEFDELALCVQQRIEPWITLEFRFIEAMDKVYGTGTPTRYARLLSRSNQAHQGRDWPPARPIDPLPRFGSLASLRLVPEPPPAPVVAPTPPPAPAVDEPTTLMVAPALSAENTASLQIAAAMAASEPTATAAVPAASPAAAATPSVAAPAEAALPEATAVMAVPPLAPPVAAAEPTASLAVPPSAEPTASLAVPPSAEPTASLAVPPSAEPTESMVVPAAAELTERMAVPTAALAAQVQPPAGAQLAESTPPATAAQGAAAASAAAGREVAQSVPEFLPTVIIDPNSLNIDRSAPMKIAPAAPAAPAAAAHAGDAGPELSGLDDLSVADWMSAADWLSAANKVDALASARSPLPSVRAADQEPAPAQPRAEAAAPAEQPAAQRQAQPEPQVAAQPVAPVPPAAPVAPPVAAAAAPAAPVPAAAPVVAPVVETTVQLTAPAAPPQTKPEEPKQAPAAAPSRPAAPPVVETGGRKKGKKGKEAKQAQARQPAPTPPAAEAQRRPQGPAVATVPTPPSAPAASAKPAAPSPAAPPSVSAGTTPPPQDSTAKTTTPARPTPSTAVPATPAAGKSGPVPPIAAPRPAAPPAAAARAAELAEPPQPGIPPAQPRPTEPGPKPELRPAASAAPHAAASAPSKSGPERTAPAATPAQPATAAPHAAAAPSQSGPRAAAPAEPAKPVAPPTAAAVPAKPAPAAAPAESTQPTAPAAAAPAKAAPAAAEPAQPSAPTAAPAKAAPEHPAATPTQPAAAAAAAKATPRPVIAPEPIPEPVNSGRLGEPILVKEPKAAAPTAVPAAAAVPTAASAVSPLPRVARPPRIATALDAGGFSPISLEAARELTGTVEDRDAIFEALCRGARSRCAFAAVFTLHGEVAFGRVALLDDWLDRAQLGRIAVQLDRPSPFRTAAKERTAFVGAVGAEAATGDPLRALNRSVPVSAAVLPVLVRGRAVALLYLDDEGYELTGAILEDLKPLLADVGQAFLRISQKTKTGGLGAEPEPSAIGEELPAVETSAWRAPSGKSPRSQPAAAGESAPTPPPAAPSVPAAASPVPQAASEQPTVPLRVSPPAATKQPAAAAPPADAARAAVPDAIHFQPTVPVSAAKAAAPQPAAPPASSAKSPPGKGDKRGGKPAEAAAPPVAVKEAAKEAVKEVAGKATLAELIERASNLDETAIDQLLAGGSEAARAVVAALPGPLRSRDRQALGDPVGGPVYSRGPLLALALRMGQAAIEPMLARLADPATPAEARYYLILCFAEAPVAAALAPLAECLYDSDDTVRMAAVSALRNFPPSSELGGIISKLRGTIDATDGKRVRFAVEALGELRVAAAVPQLINLLDHEDPALVDAVGRALQTITKQDFGRSRVRWTAWWRRRQDEPRLQWLLEGLTHPSAMLRSAAQDELTGLSGDVVGYRFDQPRRDREVARKRWAQWWQRRGYPVL